MTISYNGLWKILIDKNLQRKDLKETLKISSSTFAKMSRGETVSMDVLMRLVSINDELGKHCFPNSKKLEVFYAERFF